MLITNVTNINANIVKKIGLHVSAIPLGVLPDLGFVVGFPVFGVADGFGLLPFAELPWLWFTVLVAGDDVGLMSSVELEGLEDWGPGPGPGPFADDDDPAGVAGVAVDDDPEFPASTSIRVTARMAIIANIFRDVISNPMFFAFASSSSRFPYSHSLK